MITAIILAIVLIFAAFVGLLFLQIRSVNRLKTEYDKALDELHDHPSDFEVQATCRAKGRAYYRMIRIQEHAMFSDFPLPYYEAPDIEEDSVERDIKQKINNAA